MIRRILLVSFFLLSIVAGIAETTMAQGGNRGRSWIECFPDGEAHIWFVVDSYAWPEVLVYSSIGSQKGEWVRAEDIQPKYVNPHANHNANYVEYRVTARFSDGHFEEHFLTYRWPGGCGPTKSSPPTPIIPTSTPIPPPQPTQTPLPTLPPSPLIMFFANASTINHGDCTSLVWQTQYVLAVYYNGENVGLNDSRTECPSDTTTYILQAQTYYGQETRSVQVNVRPPPTPIPTAEISINPTSTTISAGECTTIAWSTQNVTAVYYNGQQVANNDSRKECPTVTTTYRLLFEAPNGSFERLVNVFVLPAPTNTPTATLIPTDTPTLSPTLTPSPTSTPTLTPTATNTRTNTPTLSPTLTSSPTRTKTTTSIPSNTPPSPNTTPPLTGGATSPTATTDADSIVPSAARTLTAIVGPISSPTPESTITGTSTPIGTPPTPPDPSTPTPPTPPPPPPDIAGFINQNATLLLLLGTLVLALIAFVIWFARRLRQKSIVGQTQPIGPGPLPPVGNYQILRPIGGGGQGSLYLAQHRTLGNFVALKQDDSSDPTQFQYEARLLANLSHPNLPRVTDFFIDSNGKRCLVMDYIQGENLETIVPQNGALAEATALAWLRPIFEAVTYLHLNRIVHRDIKPANIIITPQGNAMLVDFGIAKTMATGQLTRTGARGMGTAGYAPPEQYSGGTTEQSDVYALGATLYYMLTGQVPPESTHRAAGTALIPPRQLNPNISPRVEQAILTAMNLAMNQRFPSVALMEQAIY